MIHTVAETGSTNADLLELAHAGAPEGYWLRAERQTIGRGRQGRPWESPIGNCYASTLVRVRPSDPPAPTLALMAAVALEEAVSVFVPGVTIKWPNDLLLDGAKLSGILLERVNDGVVIGLGVNLAHHPDLPDRRTTSVAAHAPSPDPNLFVETLAESFSRWLARWRGEGIAVVRTRWMERAHPIGTALTVRLSEGAVDGLFAGLDSDGALLLRLPGGGIKTVHAGDVFLV